MSRSFDWFLVVVGVLLLAGATGIFGWQQARLSSSVHVMGPVVDVECSGGVASCNPVAEYTPRPGRVYRLRGPATASATRSEVGDEWVHIVYPPDDPDAARFRDETTSEASVAALMVLFGSILLALGWAGLASLPTADDLPAARWARGAAAGVGLVGCIFAYGVVGWRHVEAWSAVMMAFGLASSIAPVPVRLSPRGYPPRLWLAPLAYGLAMVALVAWLGLLAMPEGWIQGLLACAPFAAAITLPLQARLWPELELAVADRHQRAERRAQLRLAIESADLAEAMIVRIDTIETEERTATVVRRGPSGDVPLRATWGAFPGVPIDRNVWYLLVDPHVEQRAKAADGGYREVAREEWVVGARRAEALGEDLERALRVRPPATMRAWTVSLPLVVCLAGGTLGGIVLMDHTPPLSGRPVPATGLVEGMVRPVSTTGSVEQVTDWPGLRVGDSCRVVVTPTHRSGQTCRVEVSCGSVGVYPDPGAGGYTRCLTSAAGALVGEDTSMDDGDPAVRVDTRSGRVVVRARGGVTDWSVTIAIAAR